MGGFFGALFGGSNPGLNQGIAKTSQIGDFATSLGESNLTAGTNFDKAIVSGDATKTMQALAPIVSAEKTSAAQSNKTAAEFGTRSGGTAASTAATTDKVHGDITNLIGSLTGNAANSLTSSGGNLLNQGESADVSSAQLSQQRFDNWKSSILGQGIAGGVNYAESFLPVAHG
jgi:hypothetical protein